MVGRFGKCKASYDFHYLIEVSHCPNSLLDKQREKQKRRTFHCSKKEHMCLARAIKRI